MKFGYNPKSILNIINFKFNGEQFIQITRFIKCIDMNYNYKILYDKLINQLHDIENLYHIVRNEINRYLKSDILSFDNLLEETYFILSYYCDEWDSREHIKNMIVKQLLPKLKIQDVDWHYNDIKKCIKVFNLKYNDYIDKKIKDKYILYRKLPLDTINIIQQYY
jgi:hypothetical protein